MKLKFQIDMEYDLTFVIHMLRGKDWEYRAEKMGLPVDLVEEVNRADEEALGIVKKQLRKEVESKYTEVKENIEKALLGYQKSWDEIMDEFSSLVEEKSVPWFYDDYICKLTHYNKGLSNWNGNTVGRWWREDYDKQRRITAHEILLAHYFSIHRNLYNDSGLKDRQIWALAEIFAFAMTGLDEDLRKFWPWDDRGYYTNHNYPQIVELQKALEKPFLERKSFNEYVLRGIKLVKEKYNP